MIVPTPLLTIIQSLNCLNKAGQMTMKRKSKKLIAEMLWVYTHLWVQPLESHQLSKSRRCQMCSILNLFGVFISSMCPPSPHNHPADQTHLQALHTQWDGVTGSLTFILVCTLQTQSQVCPWRDIGPLPFLKHFIFLTFMKKKKNSPEL